MLHFQIIPREIYEKFNIPQYEIKRVRIYIYTYYNSGLFAVHLNCIISVGSILNKMLE